MQMAPKVQGNQEVSLGANVDDGKIIFGVVQYVSHAPWGAGD